MIKRKSQLFGYFCYSVITVVISFQIGCRDNGGKGFEVSTPEYPQPKIEFNPRTYQCVFTDDPIIIDGDISDSAWRKASWTHSFIDIEGAAKPAPYFDTRAKMLWDEDYFYIAASMEEPHLWSEIKTRDAVIFHENDFEVFIDPDGDTHSYYELEMNALNTVWDLLLLKPYRDGGPAVDAWDISGLRTTVSFTGTLNDPSDIDSCWSVEIAIPWDILGECAHKQVPPAIGDYWRVNFSRVEWETEAVGGKYIKKTDEDGSSLPEHNWVWSPQGIINMHYPEMWGLVKFVNSMNPKAEFIIPNIEYVKWELRQVYYYQKAQFQNSGLFSQDDSFLPFCGIGDRYQDLLQFESISQQWNAQIFLPEAKQTVQIFQDGRVVVK